MDLAKPGPNPKYTDASCVGTFADPLLAALADNGGPTLTMLPQAGSAAIDQGKNIACAPIAGTNVSDQRGVVRPQNGDGSGGNDCDIGAAEVCATAPPKPVLNAPADGQVVTRGRVSLDWEPHNCATEFGVQVRSGSKTGPVVWQKMVLYSLKNTDPANYEVKTASLPAGITYFWRVTAHNEKSSTGSVWRSFVRR